MASASLAAVLGSNPGEGYSSDNADKIGDQGDWGDQGDREGSGSWPLVPGPRPPVPLKTAGLYTLSYPK